MHAHTHARAHTHTHAHMHPLCRPSASTWRWASRRSLTPLMVQCNGFSKLSPTQSQKLARLECSTPLPSPVPSAQEDKVKALAMYGKNFLPALFNIVNETESSKRGLILGTITAYSSICPPELVNKLFKMVLQKLLKESQAAVRQHASNNTHTCAHQHLPQKDKSKNEETHALADIALGMVPALDADNCTYLYRTIEPLMGGHDPVLQKKGARRAHTKH